MKTILSVIRWVRSYGAAHRVISGIALLVALAGGYWAYATVTGTSGETRYVLAAAAKKTIVSSITGTGQVAASDQIDVRPKESGDITWVGAASGDTVHAGQAIAQIDATDARQAIADAEQSLIQAKLQHQKDSAQAPIDYQNLLNTLQNAEMNLETAYTNTYNALSTAYLDLPGAVTGMQNILYGYDLSSAKSQWNIDVLKNSPSDDGKVAVRTFADIAARDFSTARSKYDQAVIDYQTLTRYSSHQDLETFLTSSIDTVTAIAQALQSELNLLDAVIDDATTHSYPVSPAVTAMRSNARSYLSTTNNDLSSLLSQQTALDAAKKTINDTQHTIDIYTIGNPTGNNPISLQSSAYSIADQERKLWQLKDDLAKYTITAPFAGTLSSVTVKKFDTVSAGSSIATLITNQQIADISLNEVDAAKIKVGQKATMTFDAIDGLTITGRVAEVDAVGSVSQGVVTYTVQIAFDTQDDRIKPGMSVSASIIIDAKQNVLAVPNSAITFKGQNTYVEVFDSPPPADPTGQGVLSQTPPRQQMVETGISNDTLTEIISGIADGDMVVARTVTPSSTPSASQQAPSILGGGTRTGGGSAVRILGR